jgi:tetratricopeptide (TPR) repeat protein
MISISLPKELARAMELIDQARFGEALEITEDFEKGESLSPEDQLSVLLVKGRIYGYTRDLEKCVEVCSRAFQMSQNLGLVAESIEALIGKASIAFIGDFDKATTYILDAEGRMNSLADDSSRGMLRSRLLFVKSWISFLKGNLNGAVDLAHKCMKLTKEQKLGNKLNLANNYMLLGWITAYQGNGTKALDYAMKSLELNNELNYAGGIAQNYSLIAAIYRLEGDYDQALQYCKQSLSIKEIWLFTKFNVLESLSDIYRLKSKTNRALKYRQQAVALAEEFNITNELIFNLIDLGNLYRMIGKTDLAIEYAERSLILSEKWDFNLFEAQTLDLLILTYIDANSREKANRYFFRLSELYDNTKEKGEVDISLNYLSAKANMLRTSTRMHDRVEAQAVYREIIEDISANPTGREEYLFYALGFLCDLLLEELSLYNDPDIMGEIIPLLTISLDRAEAARNYYWLANIKLLQAKLALIQMNIKEAKKFMIEAQRIAELHGLFLLAWGISSEHDKLLEQVDAWEKIIKEEAPLVERIKLATPKVVLERIQGKRAVEPPKRDEEESILLLIMDNSGSTYFNYPFIANWDHSDLFSSFMSAFNTFSSEIFSKSIDRIRIGENTILINQVELFLTCYIIKGQSYPALQKLTRFTEAIRENTEIWQALNKSVKTSEMLELDKLIDLKTVIDEIF